ncbi:hypothetical protein HK405_003523 [Cladochytrium tenue]|nr:hypothetical protein HK405_003523 [Cladochytrium tenue]
MSAAADAAPKAQTPALGAVQQPPAALLYPPPPALPAAQPQPPTVLLPQGRRAGLRLWLLLIAAWWSYFVVHFDGTLAAIPGFRPAFGSSPTESTYPAAFPAAVLGALIPLWTRLAFAAGDRNVSVAAFAVFLLGTCLAAAAQSLVTLCVFRAVQAAGAAGIVAVCVAVCTYRVPENLRAVAINGLGAAMALGTILGQIVGAQLSGLSSITTILPFNLAWAVLSIPFGLASRKIRANHLVIFGAAIIAASGFIELLSGQTVVISAVGVGLAGLGAALALQNSLICAQATLPVVVPVVGTVVVSTTAPSLAPTVYMLPVVSHVPTPVPLRALTTAGALQAYALHLGSATLQAGWLGSLARFAAVTPPQWSDFQSTPLAG